MNAALLVLALGLGAVVLFAPKPKQEPAPGERLLTCVPDQVREIIVEHPGESRVRLGREQGRWRLTEPLEARANPLPVNSILGLCSIRALATYDRDGLDLGPMGLEPPRVRVQLDGATLAFGDTEPLDHRRYAADRERVHLIRGEVYRHLVSSVGAFVAPEIVEPGARLTGLRLPGLSLELVEGRWRADGGSGDYSQDDLNGLIERWRQARAVRVGTAADGDVPQGAETVELAIGDRSVELALQRGDPEWLFGDPRAGLVYHIPAPLAEPLLRVAPTPVPD